MATWAIRADQNTKALNDFLKTNSVGIDYYTRTHDLSNLLKEEVRSIIMENYPKPFHKPTISRFCNQVWNFIHTMKRGDMILMPTKDAQQVYVGIVTSHYHYIPGLDLPQCRDATWTGELKPNTLLQEKGDRRTVIRLDQLT